jgi:hypothetical protein
MTGHLVKRGKGWAIILELGVDDTGKRRQKWITFPGAKTAAKAEMVPLNNELNTGGCIEATSMTLAQYLVRWLEAKANVSRKTYEQYEEFIHKHFIPSLGAIPLGKLTPMHIQGYYAQKRARGRRDWKGGLSGQTLLHHHRVLKQALPQAVKWQILVRNPVEGVETPRPEDREMGVLSVEQTAQLLEVAEGTRLHLPIIFAVATGMRRGEVRPPVAGCGPGHRHAVRAPDPVADQRGSRVQGAHDPEELAQRQAPVPAGGGAPPVSW